MKLSKEIAAKLSEVAPKFKELGSLWKDDGLDLFVEQAELSEVSKSDLNKLKYVVSNLKKRLPSTGDLTPEVLFKTIGMLGLGQDSGAKAQFVHDGLSFSQRRKLMHEAGDEMVARSRERKKLWGNLKSFLETAGEGLGVLAKIAIATV